MTVLLENAKIFTPVQTIERGSVLIADDGTIQSISEGPAAESRVEKRIDLQGRILAPGFIDIHVHGGHGVTFGVDDLAQGLADYARWVPSTGVTGFLLSISTPDHTSLVAMIEEYVQIFSTRIEGARPLGLHLEGPFLNVEKKGAFNPDWLRPLTPEQVTEYIAAGRGWIRQVTIAPELPGAEAAARCFKENGVVVAMGHTNGHYEDAQRALSGGVFTHVTHTFNAQRGFDHRAPGVFGAILSSETVTTELIADNVHVHPAAMEGLRRCVGPERIVLITDAMGGAGLRDGVFDLVGFPITVKDGRATLSDGTLAGSTAKLNDCVRNMAGGTGATLREAVQMATLNPARAMRLDERFGLIAAGRSADLVVIDEDANVEMTLVNGEVVYDRNTDG